MPNMANITVKKADGATDITWYAKQPAGGSGPAIWHSDSVGDSLATRPQLMVESTKSKNGVRHVNGTMTYPSFGEDISGNKVVKDVAYFNFHTALPNGSLDADIAELAAQGANLLASTLIKLVLSSGFAPN